MNLDEFLVEDGSDVVNLSHICFILIVEFIENLLLHVYEVLLLLDAIIYFLYFWLLYAKVFVG